MKNGRKKSLKNKKGEDKTCCKVIFPLGKMCMCTVNIIALAARLLHYSLKIYFWSLALDRTIFQVLDFTF